MIDYKNDIEEAIEATEFGYKGYSNGNAVSLWLFDNKGYSLADNYHAKEAWENSSYF